MQLPVANSIVKLADLQDSPSIEKKYTHHQQPGRFLCLPETRKFSHWLLQLLAIITTEHMIEVKSVPDGKVLQPWKPNLKPKNDASLKEAPSWGFKILGSILALGGFLAISETNSEDLSSNIRWEFHQSIAFVKIQPLFLLGSRSGLHQFWRCQVICVIWEAMWPISPRGITLSFTQISETATGPVYLQEFRIGTGCKWV